MLGPLVRVRLGMGGWLRRFDNSPFALPGVAPALRRTLVDGVAERVSGRRVAFVVSSGRAGSGFLAGRFSGHPAVVSAHEPRPRMTGPFLRMAMERPLEETARWRAIKIAGVNATLLRHPHAGLYVESSHMFCKSFWDVILGYYRSVDVVVLRRDPASVLRSFLDLGYFSPRNRSWPHWFHDAEVPNRLVQAVVPAGTPLQVARAIAYLVDIEARAERFVSNPGGARVHEVTLAALRTEEGFQRLCGDLGLPPAPPQDSEAAPGRNDRTGRKRLLSGGLDMETCRRHLLDYREASAKDGVWFPGHPVWSTLDSPSR